MAANAWTLIPFDTPFVHDGTSNIVLVTDDNTNSYTTHMSFSVFDAPNQAISVCSVETNFDPVTPQPSYYEAADLLSVKNQIILTKEIVLSIGEGASADASLGSETFGFINDSGNLCIFGIEGTATLQVVDVMGRILSSESFSGSYEKRLNVVPGVYTLRFINGNNVKVRKIVIE